jgi:hypothetical protein
VNVTTADTYRENLFALVGDRDPVDVLSQTPSTLNDIILTHSATVLRARPFEGKWTPNEIIGHLVDGEWVYGYRLRLVLCEDDAPILGTKQDAWVLRQHHIDREPSEHVEIFRTLRQFNVAVWRQLSPADLTRTGRHNERGAESLAVMLRMQAGHDLSHLNQIDRYVRAIRERVRQ